MNRKKQNTPPPDDGGWSQAGLKVVTMLARRPEVQSKGVVAALQEVLDALDRKPKPVSKSYKELAAYLKVVEDQNIRIKRQRDQVIGAFLVLLEDEDKSLKSSVNELLVLIKNRMSTRVLDRCKEEGRKWIGEQ